jgi:hypothetical protein
MSVPLLILGASTRAAAFSAIRAGFEPICGDLFVDADLRQFATVLEVPRYPRGLRAATGALPRSAWCYTGALENHPGQIASVSKRHSLWGNSGQALKNSRSPWFLRQLLRRLDIPVLELQPSFNPPPKDGTWITKPRRSAAGRGVAIWGNPESEPTVPHYFQRYRPGIPASATFLALPNGPASRSGEDYCVGAELLKRYCESV